MKRCRLGSRRGAKHPTVTAKDMSVLGREKVRMTSRTHHELLPQTLLDWEPLQSHCGSKDSSILVETRPYKSSMRTIDRHGNLAALRNRKLGVRQQDLDGVLVGGVGVLLLVARDTVRDLRTELISLPADGRSSGSRPGLTKSWQA